jgi:hypothetical protein
MAKGTLIAAMNIAQAAEDEFHDWYDTEHRPERQRVPGFLVCQRWIGVPDRKVSVATYDLDDVKVLGVLHGMVEDGAAIGRVSRRTSPITENGFMSPIRWISRRRRAPTPPSAARPSWRGARSCSPRRPAST